MPSVNPKESEKKYVSRCIPVLIKEGKSADQAAAICHSMYKQSKKRKESKGDFSEPDFEKENDMDGIIFLSNL